MPFPEREIQCRYSSGWKVFVSVLLLPFAVLGLLLAFRAVAGLAAATVDLAAGSFPDAVALAGESLGSLSGGLVLLSFAALFLNLYADVWLSEQGIAVQVFWIRWIFVPWEDVLDMRPTIQARLFGHRRSRLVFVRRLTVLHRCIGWLHGLTPRPAFNIKATQEGYDEAVGLIRRKLGERGAVG